MHSAVLLEAGNVVFRLASQEDDPELRRVLRETAMPGWVRVTFEREPAYAAASAIQGPTAQVIVARHRRTNELVGFFTRSVREAFIAGERRRLGYLGQLRLAPAWRGRPRAIIRGYQLCHQLASDGNQDTPWFLTAIVEDNQVARRLLEAGVQGMPQYHYLTDMHGLVIGTRQRAAPTSPDLEIQVPESLDEVSDYLARVAHPYSLHPVWTSAELLRLHPWNLSAGDFLVARHQGQIVGCLSLWDQRKYRQIRIQSYRFPLGQLRSLVNPLLVRSGYPALPGPGQILDQAYVSHLAITDDNPRIFRTLFSHALTEAGRRGLGNLVLGFCTGHPLLDFTRQVFPCLVQRSRLYGVHWRGGDGAEIEKLSGTRLHVEVACL